MILRVYYEDTDIGGFVYYANYLKFCERARSEVFFSKNMSPCRDDYHFVVKNLSANYKKPAKFGDLLYVESRLISIKNASIKLSQSINKNADEIFSMDVELVCLKGEKISRIPQEYVEIFSTLPHS